MSIRVLLFIILALFLFPTIAVSAPVSRTVADGFEITAQFIHEPAILGDTNGIRLQISENGEPVPDALDNLVVQVEFMEAVRVLNMVSDSDQPGVYTGVFIPMQEGEYAFTMMGSIDGVEINETFTVSDGLVAVTPRTDYEFPNAAHGWGLQRLALPLTATALLGLGILAFNRRSS